MRIWFNPLLCFFDSEGHVALDRNPGPGYDTLLLRMIIGDLLSAFPHRQFHTLPGLLDSWAALPNSNPNAYMPMQGGSLYHFYGTYIFIMHIYIFLYLNPMRFTTAHYNVVPAQKRIIMSTQNGELPASISNVS